MQSRYVVLRPLEPSDVEFMFREETQAGLAFRWRLGGTHPNPYTYGESLWSGVLASFIVQSRAGSPVGITTAYSADHRDQHVGLAAALFSTAPPSGVRRAAIAVDCVALMLEYLFAGWPFRKVYLEVAQYNLGQFASITSRLAEEEARLRGHVYLNGEWWDMITLAIWREAWMSSHLRLRALSAAGDEGQSLG